jgi:outer membrane protein insertion porin family
MARHLKYLLIIFLLFSACSNTKFLPKGQKLYLGNKVKIEDKNVTKSKAKALSTELQALVRPIPNGSILGLRVKLWIWNKTQTTKTKGIRHWLHTKFGEPPVFVSAVDIDKNSSILENRLQNEGYFQAQVDGDTVSKKKTSKVVFTAQTGPAYKIRKVSFPKDTDDLDSAIIASAPKTLLKVGDTYNLDVIKTERLRIDAQLKEGGFYYFAPEDLIMKVDSTVGTHQVDIFVAVKGATVDRAREIYTINNIYVYPNYTLKDTSLKLDSAVKYRWYNVIDPKNTIRPFVFKNTVLLHPGDIYNRTSHNNTLNRFIDLGPFKYVKNRFVDVSEDTAKLDIYYFLTQYPKKSLQVELIGRTTSANYTGSQINLNWKNRNTFKGAESLAVTLFGSTDVQFSGQSSGYNVFQTGVQTTLSWPRFISPFNFNSDNAYIPRTNLTLGYTLVNRTQLYSLNSFQASFGYSWKSNEHVQNDLNLENITYVDPENITQQYQDSIKHTGNPSLAHVIDRQFTFGPSYSYTYTNTGDSYRVNTIYYNSKLSLSGNINGIISGADTLNGKVSKVLGVPFDQFIKLENEFRFYHKTGPNSTIATRIIASFGIPYGNSTILPYSQQFFIAGTNSLRGFPARSVGPGTYYFPDSLKSRSGFLPDESGDIKLEGNIEYRAKLFSIVNGAIFMDAGNIWDVNSHDGLPGAAFSKQFLSQLAADAGVGLRFDLTVLVLRTDLGFPIREPWLPEGQRWVINKIDFNSSAWRSQNLVFNLAIGYPF